MGPELEHHVTKAGGAVPTPKVVAGCTCWLPRKMTPKAASITSELAAIHQY